MEWILASASPRRKELLGGLLPAFEIVPAKGEERVFSAWSVEETVRALAAQKAREVARLPLASGKAVLGADTVVSLNGEILGKPKDEADAERMLLALAGKAHEVYTGVCISDPEKGERKELIAAACTKVYFEPLTKEQIKRYIATGSPMDKAGAYGIQDGGLVKKIEGSFSNVVGLPTELCKELLEKLQEKTETI